MAPALVFISDGEGGEVHVCCGREGAYEVQHTQILEKESWYFLILSCMTCCLKLPVCAFCLMLGAGSARILAI